MRHARPLLLLLLFASLVGPASAQEPDSVAADTAAAEGERTSPCRALFYSPGGTVLLATVGGVIYGPAIGHFYAGNAVQAWAGIGIRVVGSGLTALGMVTLTTERAYGAEPSKDSSGEIALVLSAGTVVWFGSAIYDIVTADNSVRA